MAVLYWLSTTMALTPYAGHRVAQIQERSSHKQWKYVNTADNPSDLPTRGLRAKDLASCEMWWKGPKFLRTPEQDWPLQPYIRSTAESAAETRTVEEISQQIVLNTKGHQSKERLSLILKLMSVGSNVRKALKALTHLSGLCYDKFKHPALQPPWRVGSSLA